MVDPPDDLVGFGPYLWDSRKRWLFLSGQRVKITPKPATLLAHFLTHPDQVVSAEALALLWGRVVSEAAVRKQVQVLRQLLESGFPDTDAIETVAGEGYQFVIQVFAASATSSPPNLPGSARLQTSPDDVPGDLSSVPTIVTDTSAPSATSAARTVAETLPSPTRPHPVSTGRYRWLTYPGLATALVGLGVVGAWATRPQAAPSLRLAYPRALTSDNVPKGVWPPDTDGRNVIYTWSNGLATSAVPVGGGSSQPVFGATSGFLFQDRNKDGDSLVVQPPAEIGNDGSLWVVRASATVPSRVGSLTCGRATWSPNGQFIACVYRGAIQIASSNGEVLRTLPRPATTDGHVNWPQWSPDGEVIAFTWITPVDGQDPSSALWEVRWDGTGLRPMRLGKEPGRRDCCGTWSPDSKWFIYQSEFQNTTHLFAAPERGSRIGSWRGEPIKLTEGTLNFAAPAVSPHGTAIYAVGWPMHGELVRLDTQSRTFFLDLPKVSGTWVTYSRDRQWIAYISYPDKKLWKSRVDGSDKQLLVDGPFEADGSVWSPDGTAIAFRSRMGGSALRIFVIPASGGKAVPISKGNREQGVPSWSRDSRKIVFGNVPRTFGEPDGGEAIWIHDLDTKGTTDVPGSRQRVLWTPRWSPDDRYIAAISIQFPRRIWLYDRTATTWHEVPSTERVDDMQWTRDGKALIYRTEGPQVTLKRLNVANGRAETLANLDDFPFAPRAYGWMGLAPDDSPLLLRNRGATEIYALTIEK